MTRPPKPDDRPTSPRFKDRKTKSKPSNQPPTYEALHPGQTLTPDVSLTHQKLVGRVLVAWAKLESAINDSIWQILRLETQDGRTMTAYNDAEQNLIILRTLAKRHLTDERFAALKVTLAGIKTCQEERNMIAHGTWGTLRPDGVPIALHIRKQVGIDFIGAETFPTARMKDIADRIGDSIDDLVALIRELHASPDKQPRRPRQRSASPDADQ